MPRTAQIKEGRLQMRLDAASKGVLQRAASYRRKTVSQFVLATALSSADWSIFFNALVDPPPPNAELRKAFAKYQKAKE